jgi:hypothetical protein
MVEEPTQQDAILSTALVNTIAMAPNWKAVQLIAPTATLSIMKSVVVMPCPHAMVRRLNNARKQYIAISY